jgi:glycosyltransferase involved in cell wall biosynthesis
MARKNSLSLILPIYNEAAVLENTIEKISGYLEELLDDFEIIAVNDGSTDQSLGVISALTRKNPRIKLIDNDRNRGYGWTLRQGINKASKEWLLIFDSDGQFDINDLGSLWNKKQGRDFILGWRKKRNDNIFRLLLGAGGNSLANLILHPRFFIKDINCGFKLFETSSLKPLLLTSSGGTINFEILYRLKVSNSAFVQLPVSHYPRKSGRATGGNLRTVIKIIKESARIIFDYAPDPS